MFPSDVVLAILAVGVALVPALWIAYGRRWRAAVLCLLACAVLAFVVFVICLCVGLPLPALLLAGLAFVLMPKLLRWGWLAVLGVSLFPKVARERRRLLLVVAVCWAPFGVYGVYKRFWHLPPELRPPDGFRVVERTYYPEFRLMAPSLPFGHLELRSADTQTPKRDILDGMQARLLAAGWTSNTRAEGRSAVLSVAPEHWLYERRSTSAQKVLLYKAFRWAGFHTTRPFQSMLADPGLSLMTFERGETEYWNIAFIVYDLPNARVIEAHLAGGID